MPLSARFTPKNALVASAAIAITSATFAAPSSASASTRPRITGVDAVVNRCSGHDVPITTIGAKGPALTGATVSVADTPTPLRKEGIDSQRGELWNGNPAGLRAGRRVRLTIVASSAHGQARLTRTVRVVLIHMCQG